MLVKKQNNRYVTGAQWRRYVPMFQKNLRSQRKRSGLSQEELGIKLNTARQTISKWENGVSVPDAEMLIKLAEVLEVSVNELLGADLNSDEVSDKARIAEQLSRLNEQLAIKNNRSRRIWKIVIGIILFFVGVSLFIAFLNYVPA